RAGWKGLGASGLTPGLGGGFALAAVEGLADRFEWGGMPAAQPVGPVKDDHLAGEVVGVGRTQIGGQPAQLARLADAAGGNRLEAVGDLGLERGGAGAGLHRMVAAVALGIEPWRQSVDADVV